MTSELLDDIVDHIDGDETKVDEFVLDVVLNLLNLVEPTSDQLIQIIEELSNPE